MLLRLLVRLALRMATASRRQEAAFNQRVAELTPAQLTSNGGKRPQTGTG